MLFARTRLSFLFEAFTILVKTQGSKLSLNDKRKTTIGGTMSRLSVFRCMFRHAPFLSNGESMGRDKTAVFIGHRECDELSPAVIAPFIEIAVQKGIDTFLNGGMGNFDKYNAIAVDTLKKKYPHIKQYLIKPYLKHKCYFQDLFDEVALYAPERYIELVGYRAAIPQRNEYMVLNSSIAICYVQHRSSGSYKTYQLAKDKGLTIIDIPAGGQYER